MSKFVAVQGPLQKDVTHVGRCCEGQCGHWKSSGGACMALARNPALDRMLVQSFENICEALRGHAGLSGQRAETPHSQSGEPRHELSKKGDGPGEKCLYANGRWRPPSGRPATSPAVCNSPLGISYLTSVLLLETEML